MGLAIAMVGMVIPTAIFMIVLLTTLTHFAEHPSAAGMGRAMLPVVGVMMAVMAWQFVEIAFKGLGKWVTLAHGAVVFPLFWFLGVHPAIVLAALFLTGLGLLASRRGKQAEMTAMRAFIAVVCLSAATALLTPAMTLGGMVGIFAALDFGALFDGADIVFGTAFTAIFVVMAASALNLTVNNMTSFFYMVGRTMEWPVSKLLRILKPRRREPERAEYKFDPIRKMAASKPAVKKKIKKRPAAARETDEEAPEFELPPAALLEKSNFSNNVVTREHKDIAESMEINFAKYGIKGRVREIHPGPIVTRYDFEPDDGQKIAKIIETANDMRRAMATE